LKLKVLVAVALFALGMATAVAIAKPPPGSPAEAKQQARLAAKAAAAELKCRGGHMNLGGEVVSTDLAASTFALAVDKANKKGRALVDTTATVVVGDKTKLRPKSKSTLDKLAAGDRVKVLIRTCRDAEGDAALLAKLVVAAGKPKDETEEEEEETSTSTSTSTETTSTSTETDTTTSTSP
jgi:hypothetical protein